MLGKDTHSVPDRVRDLNLFLDPKGFIRSGGRMDNVNAFSQELIHPLILGKNHPLTNLIITHCHHKVQHLGVQPILNRVMMDGFKFRFCSGIICAMVRQDDRALPNVAHIFFRP